MKLPSRSARLAFHIKVGLRAVALLPGSLFALFGPCFWSDASRDGIRIVDPRAKTRKQFTELIREGLSYVAKHDPRRYARILREIKLIVHIPTPTGAQYECFQRVCSIDNEVYQRIKEYFGNPLALACTLVHESVHGHLFTKRILETARNRPRIERVCNREMRVFAQRIGFCIDDWIPTTPRPVRLHERLKFAWRRAHEIYRQDKRS